MGTTRRIENPDHEQNSRARIKAKMRAARDSVRKKIQDGYTVPHLAGLAKDVMGGILMKSPLDEIYRMYDKEVQEYIVANKGNDKAMRNLSSITSKFLKKIDEALRDAMAYLDRMIVGGKGFFTANKVIEMRDSFPKKAATMAKILKKAASDPNTREAVEYVFITNRTQTVARYKKLCTYLSSLFDKSGGDFGNEEGVIGWYMIGYLPVHGPKSAEVFLKEYIKQKGLKGKELKEFLRAGCRYGAVSPSLAEQLIKADEGLSFTQKERNANRVIYRVQRDLRKKAKLLARVPYGSTNRAADMLTLFNGIKFAAVLASAVSLIGTGMANFSLEHPENIVKALAKPVPLVKAGIIAYAVAKPKPGFFKGQAERRQIDEEKTSKDLDLITDTNAGWSSFFTSDRYSGASAFYQFIQEYGMRSNIPNKKDTSIKVKIHKKPLTSKITMFAFKKWLDKKAKGSDPTGRYAKLAKRIKAEQGGAGSVDGNPTTTDDLRRLSAAFFTWKIGGKASQTEQAYKTALKRARGGYTPPPKKKT